MLFQELFYGPYFCQVQDPQYYSLHGADPGRPDDQADAGPRQADRHGPRRADVRGGRDRRRASTTTPPRSSTPTATYLGKYRKTHIPHVKGFWEKFYFRPGQPGLPGVRDGGRQGRRLHLLRPALPGGRPGAGPERRRDGLHPVGDVARPVRVPVAHRAGRRTPSRTATSSGRSTGSGSRRTSATTTSTASSYFVDPRGQFIGDLGAPTTRSCSSATWTSTRSRRSARRGSSTATAARTRTTTSSDPEPPAERMTGDRLRDDASLDLADHKERIVRGAARRAGAARPRPRLARP